ncbi:hypothetical protein ABXN37_19890 [Piscinibacter sakaiensis]|uniref:hypothetical protein n=1 Tax=Piscinibacter sakaiensis TaxID=1547922 RepID=UPI0037285DA0
MVVVTVDTTFTAEMLDAMPDQEIRDLAEQRGYGLHPRLGPVNLRARFLEAQDAAAAAAGQGGGETKTGPDGTAAGA